MTSNLRMADPIDESSNDLHLQETVTRSAIPRKIG
jgi:hypothetical protein